MGRVVLGALAVVRRRQRLRIRAMCRCHQPGGARRRHLPAHGRDRRTAAAGQPGARHGARSSSISLLSQPANPEPQTILVPLGGNIQAAIDAAAPGSTILLAPGTYVTNVLLPAKQIRTGRYITITTAGIDLPEGPHRSRVEAVAGDHPLADRDLRDPHQRAGVVLPTPGACVRGQPERRRTRSSGSVTPRRRSPWSRCRTTSSSIASSSPAALTGQKRGVALNAADVLDPELRLLEHLAQRPGVPGDCRLEHAGADHDPQQPAGGRQHQHHVRRIGPGDSQPRRRRISWSRTTCARRTSRGAATARRWSRTRSSSRPLAASPSAATSSSASGTRGRTAPRS